MKKFAALLFLAFLLPFFGLACSCIGEQSVKDAIKTADVVLVGKVVKAEQFSIPTGLINFNSHRIKYTISVQTLYKGEIKTETLEIITGVGGGDCGFKFQREQQYIIYATRQKSYFPDGEIVEPFLTTDICTRTTKLSKNEIQKIKKFERAKKI